ncbi:NAD(P)H-binding protein [Amycolatopsis sp. FU40]|uniref:NmrA family NAD(P)-binding protein n=1 Tax=Amycolatopsis sp. FU40 TaxID=2914159 RepID=UPI001F2C722B|nr:NAD(P)H-binding protein [Amycolatopsis sp. FU40]UKD58147.1 NAD(P)H-binding protein [Amycolatopsis sp. FU40]
MPTTVLVLGATGRTGRRVVSLLAERGHTVRAASQLPGRPEGAVTPVRFDWGDPATYPPALDGVDAIYQWLPISPDPAAEVAALLDEAKAAGVRRVVHLSTTTARLAREDFPAHGAERFLETGPVPATILRPNVFAENFSEHPAILHGIRTGVVAVPAGDGRVAPISVEDIAAAAAAALTQDGHQHKTYSLTGPDSLSFSDMTAIVGDAAGKPVRYRAMDPAEFREALLGGGTPGHVADFYAAMYEGIRNDWAADVTDDVRRITGRPPVSFADYARAAAARWR